MATPATATAAMSTATPGAATPGVGEEELVLEALATAYPLPVLYARKSLVQFRARSSPLPRLTFSLQSGDYLHFKQPYGSGGWWVGRVVGERPWLGLVPGEAMLLAYHQRREEEEGEGEEGRSPGPVYEDAPIMRPIVLVGPSRKDAELTELLHKPLLSYINDQFTGRLHTIKPLTSVAEGMSEGAARSLRGEIFRTASTLNLVLLDCDASFPGDVTWLQAHPLLVYVQVARRKVLQRLVRELSSGREEREKQLQAAYRLYEVGTFAETPYSLVISDSDLDDACQTLELFLESYWAATRSVRLTPINPHPPS